MSIAVTGVIQKLTGETKARYIHLIVHIPKCAGSTVYQHLHRNLGDRRVLSIDRRKAPSGYLAKRRYLSCLDLRDPDHIDVLTGHDLPRAAIQQFPGRQSREIVLIRDPISRYVSHFNYFCSLYLEQPADRPAAMLEQWYATQRTNYMTERFLTRYLGISEAVVFAMAEQTKFDLMNEALKHFWYVADYRTCEEMLTALSKTFGISSSVERSNITPRKYLDVEDVPEPVRSRIASENMVDQAIYDLWREVGFLTKAPRTNSPDLARNPFNQVPRKIIRPYARIRLKLQTRDHRVASPQ